MSRQFFVRLYFHILNYYGNFKAINYEKYELFVNGESLGTFHEIPEDFKDYPVYAEKPDADENPSDNQGDNKSTADDD